MSQSGRHLERPLWLKCEEWKREPVWMQECWSVYCNTRQDFGSGVEWREERRLRKYLGGQVVSTLWLYLAAKGEGVSSKVCRLFACGAGGVCLLLFLKGQTLQFCILGQNKAYVYNISVHSTLCPFIEHYFKYLEGNFPQCFI